MSDPCNQTTPKDRSHYPPLPMWQTPARQQSYWDVIILSALFILTVLLAVGGCIVWSVNHG